MSALSEILLISFLYSFCMKITYLHQYEHNRMVFNFDKKGALLGVFWIGYVRSFITRVIFTSLPFGFGYEICRLFEFKLKLKNDQ